MICWLAEVKQIAPAMLYSFLMVRLVSRENPLVIPTGMVLNKHRRSKMQAISCIPLGLPWMMKQMTIWKAWQVITTTRM